MVKLVQLVRTSVYTIPLSSSTIATAAAQIAQPRRPGLVVDPLIGSSVALISVAAALSLRHSAPGDVAAAEKDGFNPQVRNGAH